MEITRSASTWKYIKPHTYNILLKCGLYSILLASYSFLAYRILTFQHYEELASQWNRMPLSHLWWLSSVIVLLPVNWYLEALKWKMLTSRVQQINLNTSIQAVLSGISTGFFTPNRVGELVGRVSFLESGNRKAGVTLSFMNSLTQNVIMAVCGIPACLLFFSKTAGKLLPDIEHIAVILLSGILLIGILSFYFRRRKDNPFFARIRTFTDCLSLYEWTDLIQIMAVSLLRYVVFCLQFYFMLCFFGIDLTPWQAVMAIPTVYLFVTFTPSMSFSEAAIRSSYAVLVIGAFSGQVVSIALAGVSIWTVNFVIPMLAGSVVMVRKKG